MIVTPVFDSITHQRDINALDPNVAWFKSGTFELSHTHKIWPNEIPGGASATLSGDGLHKVAQFGGHGAGLVTALEGTTEDSIDFGDIIKNEFTICSVTRYTGSANQELILRGDGGDGKRWLHGQWNGK